jgi:hypothetical protein
MIVAFSHRARDFDPATLLCKDLVLSFMDAMYSIETSIRQPFYLMAKNETTADKTAVFRVIPAHNLWVISEHTPRLKKRNALAVRSLGTSFTSQSTTDLTAILTHSKELEHFSIQGAIIMAP